VSRVGRGPLVVAGGSVAGVRVVHALRAGGYDERIVLVDREDGLPYDKPALSKGVLTGEEPQPPPLLTADGLRDLAVEHLPATEVTRLDLHARRLDLDGGARLGFDRLVIATGSHPRRLPALDGMAGVHHLRTRADAHALRAELAGAARVAIVGGGFVGCEVAAAARERGLDVTIVEAGPRLLGRVAPAAVSAAVLGLHTDHGTRVVCGRAVVGYRGSPRVEALELDDGAVLPVDLVVVGIGSAPATGWLGDSGLDVGDGVRCGPGLAAEGVDGVWAVGDVARWADVRSGHHVRTEHWTTAREQAAYVARAVTSGVAGPFTTTGYVWSDQYDVRIQHVGARGTATGEVPTGDGRGRLFLHRDDGEVVGATALNAPRDLLAVRRALTAGGTTPLKGHVA
jgi:3-phenylpropionate/trans-cinnamate dioxygenase ferredoxin reductase subunit